MWNNFLFPLLSGLLFILPCDAQGKTVNVRTLEELVKAGRNKDMTLVVKKDISLNGRTVILSEGSVLSFNGGSLMNGTIVGNKSKVKKTRANVFHNCDIKGEWDVTCSYSTMFDVDKEAVTLLKNMSCLSPVLKLADNRSYDIQACGEIIYAEVIEGDRNDKPTITFHTTDPNVTGMIIHGARVTLRNLIVTDDYDLKNDAVYGANRPTIGNTISVIGPQNTVETLTVEGCDFRGGTSSSWVASSQTKNCQVDNCTFTGYMADHGVYCSMKAESFKVDNCTINDVSHVSGLFKVRTSDKLRLFSVSNTTAHNYNGYLAMVSLLETPEAVVLFDHIKVTKDEGNNSVFYGFCMNDETKNMVGVGYNAERISITNCTFGYGYDGNSVIYSGAGNRVCSKRIIYECVNAVSSNFAGGIVDEIMVNDCIFKDCSGDKGIYISAKEVTIKNSSLINRKHTNCLFLINSDIEYTDSIILDRVDINFKTENVFDVRKGKFIDVNLIKCRISKSAKAIITSTDQIKLNFVEKGSLYF